MAFTLDTKANIAYKRVLGKIHTNNGREAFNEPLASKFLMAAQTIWAEEVRLDPEDPSNAGIVSEKLTLNLEPVSGTGNTGVFSAYVLKLGALVPDSLSGKTNRLTGLPYEPNDRVGQIIPLEMGPGYQPRPYEGTTAVYPFDASDWFIDNYSGVLTQETDNPNFMRNYTLGGSKFECYVYVGKMITEAFGGLGGGQTFNFYDKQRPRVLDAPGGNVISAAFGITGDQDGQNRVFTLAHACAVGSEHVYLNGSLLQSGKDYTIVAKVITFSPSVETSPGSGVFVDRVPMPEDLVQVSYREQA